MMTRCAHCPLRGGETDCPAVTRPHPRFCELMDPGHPDHDASYARPILMLAGQVPADRAPGSAPAPQAANVHEERRQLILGCDYRLDAVGLERGDGCGCVPATRCLLRKGKWSDDPLAVGYDDCLVCVS